MRAAFLRYAFSCAASAAMGCAREVEAELQREREREKQSSVSGTGREHTGRSASRTRRTGASFVRDVSRRERFFSTLREPSLPTGTSTTWAQYSVVWLVGVPASLYILRKSQFAVIALCFARRTQEADGVRRRVAYRLSGSQYHCASDAAPRH